MNLLVSKIMNITLAFIVAVFSVNVLAVMDVAAKPVKDPAGNNGTLKVHEAGTPDGTESNSPKVCTFNFEGFGFDNGQDGYIVIDTQPGNVATETLPFGPADANGDDATAYINDGVSGFSVPNGHYKATLYGKDTGGTINLADEKAKSKVFKVECDAKPTVPTVTVQAGPCALPGTLTGTASGSVANTDDATDDAVIYTITALHQVSLATQSLNVTIADGATGNFNFTGLAPGVYSLTVAGDDGTATAPTAFTIAACDIIVTPTVPTKVDLCGTANDTYTIPATTGVTYLVNGIPTIAGTYVGAGNAVITAVANSGYVLRDTATWTFNFKTTPCITAVTPTAPTKLDLCGKANDTYTIPTTTGVNYYVNGQLKAAGTYNTNFPVLIVAVAKSGYALTIHSQLAWLFVFTNKKCAEPCVPTIAVAPLTFFGGYHDEEDCIPVSIVPTTPTFTDTCGVTSDQYTIPVTAGVIYKVNGMTKTAGSYSATRSVVITAETENGYALGQGAVSQWVFEFTDKACPTSLLSAAAVCSADSVAVTLTNTGNADGVAYVNGIAVNVPANSEVETTVPFAALTFNADVLVVSDRQTILMDASFSCEPGRGAGTLPVETPTTPSVSIPLAPASGLPMTGSNGSFMQVIIMLIIAAATYGSVYYLQNRRKLEF